MSYSLSVIIPHDVKTPEESDNLHAWLAKEEKYSLYGKHFGSDTAIYHFWSKIGALLDLPYVASIYKSGIRIDKANEFDQFEEELQKMETYWRTHDPINPYPKLSKRKITKKEIIEHIKDVHEAISIARRNNAILCIC